jgi:serine/threonine-protein kinase Chk1
MKLYRDIYILLLILVLLLSESHISASQPEPRRHLDICSIGLGVTNGDSSPNEALWFSQPVHPDNMLLSSQVPCTPGNSQVRFN